MKGDEARARLESALRQLIKLDRHLLENDVSERCIASRLAMYLQAEFPDFAVDVEYNRQGKIPKKLGLPDERPTARDVLKWRLPCDARPRNNKYEGS